MSGLVMCIYARVARGVGSPDFISFHEVSQMTDVLLSHLFCAFFAFIIDGDARWYIGTWFGNTMAANREEPGTRYATCPMSRPTSRTCTNCRPRTRKY